MNVVITGGLSGLGLALAKFFKDQGHEVHVTGRTKRAVPGLHSYALELQSSESIEAFVRELPLAKIDLFINNAGRGVLGPLTELHRDQMREQFETNLFGPLELLSKLLPRMKGGHLVNVSSISPEINLPFGGIYSASKAAMNSVSDVLGVELAHLGIKVTTVRPGLLQTSFASNADQSLPMADDSSFLKYRSAIQERTALAHAGSDPDVVAARLGRVLLKKNCPAVIYLGKGSTLWPLLMKLLPVKLKQQLLIKKYGLV